MNPNRITLDLVVKAGDPDPEHPAGTFKAVLSTARLDRDGEVIDPHAFEPLPDSIPIHTDHRMTVDTVVARAVPFYDNGTLKARGYYGSDPRSQEVRTKVDDGLVTSMSVGAIRPERATSDDGTPHITKATLIEASMVTIPANTDALIAAKSLAADLEHALEDPAPEVRGEADDQPDPAPVGTEPADPVAAPSDNADAEPPTIDPEPATTDPDGTAGAPEAPAAPLAQVIADTDTALDAARIRALEL